MFLKQPMKSSGTRKLLGSEFQTVGEAWKKPRGSIVFLFCSRDNEKTLLERSWAQGGTGGRYLHWDAIVREVILNTSSEFWPRTWGTPCWRIFNKFVVKLLDANLRHIPSRHEKLERLAGDDLYTEVVSQFIPRDAEFTAAQRTRLECYVVNVEARRLWTRWTRK